MRAPNERKLIIVKSNMAELGVKLRTRSKQPKRLPGSQPAPPELVDGADLSVANVVRSNMAERQGFEPVSADFPCLQGIIREI